MSDTANAELRPDPSLHISMPFQGRWVRKAFVRGLGFPRRHVYSVLRGIKSRLMPGEVRAREERAALLVASEPGLAAWRETGSRPLRPAELAGIDSVLESCRAIHHGVPQEPPSEPAQGKDFLHFVATDREFLAHPAVIDFVLSEPILRTVSAYLGTVPVLASVALLSSPPLPEGTPPCASQRFHNDHEDVTQVKLFVHVEDVAADHGVFTFHPAEATRRIRSALGTRRGRLDDAEVARVVAGADPVTLVGPAGSAWFVDTSRCLHFGSRPSNKHRLVLLAQYLRCNSPALSNLALTLNAKEAAEERSPLARMVLGLR